jgi:hypothetical protein
VVECAGLENRKHDQLSLAPANISEITPKCLSASLPLEIPAAKALADHDLSAIVAAWPSLQEEVRTMILGLVKLATRSF